MGDRGCGVVGGVDGQVEIDLDLGWLVAELGFRVRRATGGLGGNLLGNGGRRQSGRF
jgi:hypothetical protein